MKSTGVVAFFDILGYKSFLRNGKCDEAAELVVRTIAQAETDIVSYLQGTSAGEAEAQEFMSHVGRVTWVVFSDTLLLLCPFEDMMSEREAARRWHVIILSAQILSKHMFEEGLPLRGCISYGQFIQEENCFAGKTILDAHDTANSLEMAASVVHSTAFEELRRVVEPFANAQELTAKILLIGSIVDYAVPTKTSKMTLHTLNFTVVKGIARVPNAWLGDCTDIVMRSFKKHNKTLGDKERAMAENTASYLSFLETKFPGSLNQETQ
jgi:hypothetical protein